MKRVCAGLLALWIVGTAVAEEAVDINAIRQMADRGDRTGALTQLDKALKANENDIQARFLKGILLYQGGNNNEAQEVFADITRRFPRLPEAYNNLAALYADQGEYEKARTALLSAVGNAPDYSTSRANLGDLYVKMALDAYRKAVELDPKDQAAAAKLKLLEQMFKD